MASKSRKKTTASSRSNQRSSGRKSQNIRQYTERESALFYEVGLIVAFALAVIFFMCNFGFIGTVGDVISDVMFGILGWTAYIAPILFFVGAVFRAANIGNTSAALKLTAGIVLFLIVGVIFELFGGIATGLVSYDMKEIYIYSSLNNTGGGVLAGSLTYLLYHFLDMVGTVLILIVISIICLVILTEKSFVSSMKNSGRRVMELSREDANRRRDNALIRRQEQEEWRLKREEEKRLREEEKENEKILRMDKKVSGVMLDTTLSPKEETHTVKEDIHEIILEEEPEFSFDKIRVQGVGHIDSFALPEMEAEVSSKENTYFPEDSEDMPVPVREPNSTTSAHRPMVRPIASTQAAEAPSVSQINHVEKKNPKKYIFPPLSRLQKGKRTGQDSGMELRETAKKLQQTLSTFGVRATITNISQGPSVTRYELQPEMGVKVSKIVGLSDDIKLNLAATDIRIEAPIPGKAAVGIEVPNKENAPVPLRELLESTEFKEFPSNLAFAVGKDIGGKVVVADIAKMPHMLIAGATGSGKSVCINTLIMSILYKAHPDDVKMIMVDPKVVELSVYNGIPHLLIPVVTDPKKAAGALQWGVAAMTERYQKFADLNVRDLKSFNNKVKTMQEEGREDAPAKMPQIVIIVDELADLMMVAPGEVEESICRLAQLARAAGIHLVIATQRPSVDVITGLIKANMPSRVAFSVSSGVDSRTILDMNGAEKLLGKGDMLFYPQGYPKPARIQGAFVSDKEVADVVDFLKNQTLGNTYAEDVEEKIHSLGVSSGGSSASGSSADNRDEYFAEAGKFLIEKDKASIGMMQRVFKIGFNRAARIMDQLCECGVVSEEEGTKARKILMSMEQFEQLLEEI